MEPAKHRPALLLAALAVLLALGGCGLERAIEARRVLADLAAGGEESALKRATPAPRRMAVSYATGAGPQTADLYRPGEPARAALVLVPGVTPEGKDDPRLVALAMTLARARFLVLVPEIARLRALWVGAEDAGRIAAALRHLASRTGAGEEAALGLAAISYAAGPALIATQDPSIARLVRFVALVGPYYDLSAVVTFFTTGRYRAGADEPWRYRAPNAYGKWVFVRNNAGRLSDPADRAALAEMARRKLADLDAPVADLVRGLGPEGRAVHALLENRYPERVGALIAALPRPIRAEMAALDLARLDWSGARARLIVVHGRDDAIIPYTESVRLAGAWPRDRVSLYLVGSLAHVELTPGGLWDTLTLWRAVYALLSERDRAPDLRRPLPPR